MPVYEYRCKDCGCTFEAEQRIIDPPLNACRMCGGSVERLISRSSFVLKGDGWYVSEHPSTARKKALEKEKKPNGTSDSTGGDKIKEASSCPAPTATPA
ncbi:MAG: zinc ribbon domain-containing protein [bacterium]